MFASESTTPAESIAFFGGWPTQESWMLKHKFARGKTLLEDGFPSLRHFDKKQKLAYSTLCAGFQADLERPEDCLFRALQVLPSRKFAPGLTWKEAARISYWDAERFLAYTAMTEIARTYQQSCEFIEVADLVDSNPSISVLRSPQEPMAVIHVEKDHIDMEAYRQASRYLANLRLDCGVSAPIGIITTYNKWQFCWHKYASPVAEATTIEEVQRFCAPELGDADFSLCVSPVYSYDNPCLLQLLASFLVKVTHVPSCAPIINPWRLLTPGDQRIRLGRLDLAKVRHYDMVPKSAGELFWVKLMGRGSEGLVLKMATENGECCAAKFCEASSKILRCYGFDEVQAMRAERCHGELGRWVQAYGKDCGVRVTKLGGQPVILMPFYEPLSDTDWEKPETMEIVMDHFKELATRNQEEEERNGTGKRKVFHYNVKRCHVMWGDKDHTCVRLIDWGRAYNDASLPNTSDDVRAILQSDLSPEAKENQVALLVRKYLEAVRDVLQKPVPTVEIKKPAKVITVPTVDDDYGEKFKDAFHDPLAELYDRDRAAFHAEVKKQY